MSSRTPLDAAEVQTRLRQLPHWSVQQGRLRRELTFRSFVEAFGFMTSVALVAQRMDHHPAFENVYNRVTLQLWTHDAGGITPLDFELAQAAERLLAGFS